MNFAFTLVFPAVGPTELIILLTIVLLLFGAKKIPELAKGLGTGVREFRRGTSGEADRSEVKDREEGKELPQGRAVQSEKVSEEDENARTVQVEQKH